MTSPARLKSQISQIYAEKLQGGKDCCEGVECCNESYPVGVLEHAPEGVVSFGCGNPTVHPPSPDAPWGLHLWRGRR